MKNKEGAQNIILRLQNGRSNDTNVEKSLGHL